jgi:hypothetical protein
MAGGRQWLIHLYAEFRVLLFYRIFDIRVIQMFGTVHTSKELILRQSEETGDRDSDCGVLQLTLASGLRWGKPDVLCS